MIRIFIRQKKTLKKETLFPLIKIKEVLRRIKESKKRKSASNEKRIQI